jgi:hypothetical protein
MPNVQIRGKWVAGQPGNNDVWCMLVQVAAAKDVAAFAGKYKEAKRCRAYEAYQHLAAAVSFDSSGSSTFDSLLQLVRDKLASAGSPSVRTKLEQLLTAAARGLAQNPSVTGQTLAAWIGVQLDACLRVEEAARAKAQGPVGAAVSNAAAAASRKPAAAAAAAVAAEADTVEGEEAAAAAAAAAAGDGSAHLYLLSHFCVNVLNSSLKKGLLSGSSQEVLGLLDPLLPLLVRGLASRHMGTVQVGPDRTDLIRATAAIRVSTCLAFAGAQRCVAAGV